MTADAGWDLLVARDDFARTSIVEAPVPEVAAGEVLLRVDRVGMTANNVTYALMGDALRYWEFFPAPHGWGRVPLWGFADVVASAADGVVPGERFYGYLPTSSHLVVRAARGDAAGFRDVSAHRSSLPGPYNIYARTSADPSYRSEDEDLQILYRPLFITSFMLDDHLADSGFFGAATVVLSSASSKTAYGTAFCVARRERRPRVVGLTSSGNVDFTRSLGCYDDVLSYDDVAALPSGTPTAYVDVAGSAPVRRVVHEHLGDSLRHDLTVGATHHDALPGLGGAADLPGPPPVFFFAPDQIRKRRADWGPGGIDQRYAATWRDFAPVVRGWVEVSERAGPDGLRAAWAETLSGASDPHTGLVVAL